MAEVIKILGFILLLGSVRPMIAAPPPELIMTWQAQNYAPDFFVGKKLPIRGTTINLAAQLIENNRLIDASDKEIRWYVDNNLIASGIGLNIFSFPVPQNSRDTISIRGIVIYQGAEINQFLEIPIIDPEVVVDQDRSSQLKPYFYFFNIKNPKELRLDWAEEATSITLTAQNPKNLLEAAQVTINK